MKLSQVLGDLGWVIVSDGNYAERMGFCAKTDKSYGFDCVLL